MKRLVAFELNPITELPDASVTDMVLFRTLVLIKNNGSLDYLASDSYFYKNNRDRNNSFYGGIDGSALTNAFLSRDFSNFFERTFLLPQAWVDQPWKYEIEAVAVHVPASVGVLEHNTVTLQVIILDDTDERTTKVFQQPAQNTTHLLHAIALNKGPTENTRLAEVHSQILAAVVQPFPQGLYLTTPAWRTFEDKVFGMFCSFYFHDFLAENAAGVSSVNFLRKYGMAEGGFRAGWEAAMRSIVKRADAFWGETEPDPTDRVAMEAFTAVVLPLIDAGIRAADPTRNVHAPAGNEVNFDNMVMTVEGDALSITTADTVNNGEVPAVAVDFEVVAGRSVAQGKINMPRANHFGSGLRYEFHGVPEAYEDMITFESGTLVITIDLDLAAPPTENLTVLMFADKAVPSSAPIQIPYDFVIKLVP